MRDEIDGAVADHIPGFVRASELYDVDTREVLSYRLPPRPDGGSE